MAKSAKMLMLAAAAVVAILPGSLHAESAKEQLFNSVKVPAGASGSVGDVQTPRFSNEPNVKVDFNGVATYLCKANLDSALCLSGQVDGMPCLYHDFTLSASNSWMVFRDSKGPRISPTPDRVFVRDGGDAAVPAFRALPPNGTNYADWEPLSIMFWPIAWTQSDNPIVITEAGLTAITGDGASTYSCTFIESTRRP